ncbi:GtrA family protein [Jeotgalibaca arthritidis]|uniref:GtrA/DPMS transmembrane domain-containing protein n=1 Tax=Jeotgalibaca arthritidis TaxID=1868794 RepID=A0A6G7K887_9LACT|nr:GtrA family protein [Jeotgalibaca arthritidis]QII81452.1 hypothetical protein G7057_02490 [Jeotgalibaca arthritidis]
MLRTFFKYLFSSGASFIIDISLYAFFMHSLPHTSLSTIFIASLLSRFLSALFNYYVNRRFVFSSAAKNSMLHYFSLVVVQISASALFVYLLHLLFKEVDTAIIKAVVDGGLFFASYYIQKTIIFKR